MSGAQRWVAAYNLPMKRWYSGGSIADYEPEHNDIFLVMASDRRQAEQEGRKIRRKCTQIKGSTRLLLDSLLAEQRLAGKGCSFDLNHGEEMAAARLERLGLLEFVGDGPQSGSVRLTVSAGNPCMAPGEVRMARAGQNRLESNTAQPGVVPPAAKPRL